MIQNDRETAQYEQVTTGIGEALSTSNTKQ